MRCFCVGCVLCIAAFFSASAQDGIYGSFNIGKKFVDMAAFNDTLAKHGLAVTFPSNYWSLGGEGHVVVARHFVLGGKGYAFSWEKKVSPTSDRRLKLTGGMGIGSVGYSINIADNVSNALRLYPQLGAGVSTFLFQSKTPLDSIASFGDVISDNNDNMTVIQKVGLVLDASVSVDWYLKFIHLLSIVPGLETGPFLHLEAGYSITPATLRWMRDVDQLDYHPNLKFDGLYTSVGLGLAFSIGK